MLDLGSGVALGGGDLGLAGTAEAISGGGVAPKGSSEEEMRDVLVDGEVCGGVLGPGPAVRAYEEG